MIIIYSDKALKGVAGVYCAPRLFKEIDKRATTVITNDKAIAEAYQKLGVEVKGFPRSKSTQPQQPTPEA